MSFLLPHIIIIDNHLIENRYFSVYYIFDVLSITYLQVKEIFSAEWRRSALSMYHVLLLLSLTSLDLVEAPSRTKFVTCGTSVVMVTPSEHTTFDFSFALLTATTDMMYMPSVGAWYEANVLYVSCVFSTKNTKLNML